MRTTESWRILFIVLASEQFKDIGCHLYYYKYYKHMSNHICCIITLQQKDYQYIAPRLSAYGFSLMERKPFQISLMSPPQKKKEEGLKKTSRKFQSSIVRLTEPNNSTFLFASPNSKKYDENFIYEANYLRMQNSFIKMIKEWNYFKDLKEVFKKQFQIQIYDCKQAFQLQFYHSDGQDEQILMIMSDLTSTSYVDKYPNTDKQFWKLKIGQHFRDLYCMLGSSYQDVNQFQVAAGTKNKSAQFEQISKTFIQKIVRMQASQNISQQTNQLNMQQQTSNPNVKVFFKILKTACIVQFLLSEYQKQKAKQNQKQKPRKEMQMKQKKQVSQK